MKVQQLIWILAALALFLPNQNHSADAWDYAAGLQHGFDLFEPHHLLHNIPAWLVQQVFIATNIKVEAMALMCLLNALYGVFVLQLLAAIFKRRGFTNQQIMPFILLAGASWGMLRFTSENETYVLPILFSLLGVNALEKSKENGQPLYWAGFWFAFACLFHQLQVWWWLAALIGVIAYNRKQVIAYILPALVVPIGYLLVHFLVWEKPFTVDALSTSFFQVLVEGNLATVNLGNTVLLWLVGIGRSVLQIHGYMLMLPGLDMKWYLAFTILPVAFLYLVWQLWRERKQTSFTVLPLGWVLPVLLLAFSFYSGGNAEFLVGLPITLLLWLQPTLEGNTFRNLALWVLAWNVSLGLAPLNKYEFQPFQQEAQFVNENPDSFYISDFSAEVNAILTYKNGLNGAIVRPGKVGVVSDTTLEKDIALAFKQSKRVYTSSLNTLPLSRAGYLASSDTWWKAYRLQSRTTFVFAGQTWTVWELLPRK